MQYLLTEQHISKKQLCDQKFATKRQDTMQQ